jgi:hypothetical protein
MLSRRTSVWFQFALVLCISLLLSSHAFGQYRGRKYKAPPPTSRITVTVVKHFNGKPIPNAAVVFNPSKDGKDLGNLEVKTDPNGKAVIDDMIPTGSLVRVQVIADGFATYGQDFQIDQPTKEIHVVMLSPQEQISAYENNGGKASIRKPGVQEPNRPTPPPASTTNTPLAPQ